MINLEIKCYTTGWHNNCGLNCLANFISDKIESGQVEALPTNPHLNDILKAFSEYYNIPNVTWKDIHQLINQYPVPMDREAILGPVFRVLLSKVLEKNAAALWEIEGAATLSEFLTTGEVSDVARPIFKANEDQFYLLKTKFLKAVNSARISVPNPITNEEQELAVRQLLDKKPPQEFSFEQLQKQIEFNRMNKIQEKFQAQAKTDWLKKDGGCQNYADHMANLKTGEMVSVNQLDLLGQHLGIGIEVYTPASIQAAQSHEHIWKETHGAQNLPDYPHYWRMKVYNSGAHWEYEEPHGRSDLKDHHNQYYKSENEPGYIHNNKWSGNFKLCSSHPASDADIINQVKNEIEMIYKSHAHKNPSQKAEFKEQARSAEQDAAMAAEIQRRFDELDKNFESSRKELEQNLKALGLDTNEHKALLAQSMDELVKDFDTQRNLLLEKALPTSTRRTPRP